MFTMRKITKYINQENNFDTSEQNSLTRKKDDQ